MGFVLTILCALIGGALAAVTHFDGGSAGAAFSKLPLWLTVFIVIRAGVVEEFLSRLRHRNDSRPWV